MIDKLNPKIIQNKKLLKKCSSYNKSTSERNKNIHKFIRKKEIFLIKNSVNGGCDGIA